MRPGALQSRAVYRFDQFCLDLARGTLRDPASVDIALRPKAFLLLCHLLEHPNRLHSRDDLFEALWPGVVVSDDSLTQCVSDLRRALGSRANHVLRTVPRRGYMLSVDVEKQANDPAPVQRTAMSPATYVSDPESSRRELILMERIPASHGDGELLEDVRNELFLQLARFEDLQVVRSNGGLGPQGYRIRSDGRISGGNLVASVLLEDSETGAVIWTEQLNESIADRAGMTERAITPLAHHIARQAASETRRRARQKSPASLNARELCLLASDHHKRGTEPDTATAHACWTAPLPSIRTMLRPTHGRPMSSSAG